MCSGEEQIPRRALGIGVNPFEWRDKFPPAAEISRDLQNSLLVKWKKELFS
jgi:hypothetical protein